jgi:hypothetical protein
MTAIRAAIVAASLTAAVPAAAHHGWGGYDADKILTLTGTVEQFAFRNPHAMLNLKADGQVWHVALAPPGRMTARGLPEDSVALGRTVSVTGYPSKTEAGELRAERIVVDGKIVELR